MDYKYVDLVIKLQELADPTRGGTEGERENAAGRARHLMAKHGIVQGTVDIRREILKRPHLRRVWTPDPPPSAANVARRNGFDPVKWRRFLRAQGIHKGDYEVFNQPARVEDLVSRFRARNPSR